MRCGTVPKYQTVSLSKCIQRDPPLFAKAAAQQEAEQEKVCMSIKHSGLQWHEWGTYNAASSRTAEPLGESLFKEPLQTIFVLDFLLMYFSYGSR